MLIISFALNYIDLYNVIHIGMLAEDYQSLDK